MSKCFDGYDYEIVVYIPTHEDGILRDFITDKHVCKVIKDWDCLDKSNMKNAIDFFAKNGNIFHLATTRKIERKDVDYIKDVLKHHLSNTEFRDTVF